MAQLQSDYVVWKASLIREFELALPDPKTRAQILRSWVVWHMASEFSENYKTRDFYEMLLDPPPPIPNTLDDLYESIAVDYWNPKDPLPVESIVGWYSLKG